MNAMPDASDKWISGSYGDDELCAIAAMPHSTLIRHIGEGALRPMDDRKGRGYRRRWGPMGVKRAVVIAALQRAGLPRKVAAKISYAVRGESVLYWEFEARPETNYFLEIVDNDLVFHRIRRGKRFGQPGLIGRLVADGSDFVPSWDWREEENWMRDGVGSTYTMAFYYPKWQEPFFNAEGEIKSWPESFFADQPKSFHNAFMKALEVEGRFAAYDRLKSGDFIITNPLCSEEFKDIEIDESVTDDQAAAAYDNCETRLTINLTKPLREAMQLAQSEEFDRQAARIVAASDEGEDE